MAACVQIRAYATRRLTAVWNVRYSAIHCVANLLAGLAPYQELVGIHVIDCVLEDIRLGMEVATTFSFSFLFLLFFVLLQFYRLWSNAALNFSAILSFYGLNALLCLSCLLLFAMFIDESSRKFDRQRPSLISDFI